MINNLNAKYSKSIESFHRNIKCRYSGKKLMAISKPRIAQVWSVIEPLKKIFYENELWSEILDKKIRISSIIKRLHLYYTLGTQNPPALHRNATFPLILSFLILSQARLTKYRNLSLSEIHNFSFSSKNGSFSLVKRIETFN